MRRIVLLTTMAFAAMHALSALAADEGGLRDQTTCHEQAKEGSSQRPLLVTLIDREGQARPEELQMLRNIACKALAAATRAAEALGEATPWMNGLPVVLLNTFNGELDQAAFVRRYVGGEFPRMVIVTKSMLNSYSEDEAIWTLGHELGHGVHGHYGWRVALIAGALTLCLLCGGGLVILRGKKRLAAGIVALVVTATAVAGLSAMSMEQELVADRFGLLVLRTSGRPPHEAKGVAETLLLKHPESDGGWTSIRRTHPSMACRIANVHAWVP